MIGTCKECGNEIQVPEGADYCFCTCCGTKFVVEQAAPVEKPVEMQEPDTPVVDSTPTQTEEAETTNNVEVVEPEPANSVEVVEPATTSVETKKKSKKVPIIIAAVISVLAIAAVVMFFVVIPANNYSAGKKAFEDGKYKQAQEYFSAAGSYSDAKAQLMTAKKAEQYALGLEALENEDFTGAQSYFEAAGDYEDAAEAEQYVLGRAALEEADFASAKDYFESAADFKDAQSLYNLMHAAVLMYGGFDIDNLSELVDVMAAIDLQEDAPSVAVNLLTFMRGDIYMLGGKLNKAKSLYSQLDTSYSINGHSVYERLATIQLVGTWKIYRVLGTTTANGVDTDGSILTDDDLTIWGRDDDDGDWHAISTLRYYFKLGGEITCPQLDIEGTWEVDTSDITDDGTYYYNIGGKKAWFTGKTLYIQYSNGGIDYLSKIAD